MSYLALDALTSNTSFTIGNKIPNIMINASKKLKKFNKDQKKKQKNDKI
jgi:hypothetical protein